MCESELQHHINHIETAQRTSGILNLNDYDYNVLYNDVHNVFDFTPTTIEEMYGYMEAMDLSSSSCIQGVNMKICKASLDSIPSKFRHLFATSLVSGKFPNEWTCAYVTLIPKSGDKTSPGNWRPMSQTNIFANILEKLVHAQLLTYLHYHMLLDLEYIYFHPKQGIELI